jgi:hypothetical protein
LGVVGDKVKLIPLHRIRIWNREQEEVPSDHERAPAIRKILDTHRAGCRDASVAHP